MRRPEYIDVPPAWFARAAVREEDTGDGEAGQSNAALAGRPDLSRSLALRAPDLDALGYIQVALLGRKRHGAAPDDRVTLTQAIQLTINGVAAGLRNTG